MSDAPDPTTGTGGPGDPGTDPGTGGTPEPERLRYRLLTGPDDRTFCERISAALDEGYVLHGGPAATFDGTRVIVAQAVVLPDPTPTTGPVPVPRAQVVPA
ncbi:DUF1737 domain-containing protein [Cellulomonas cellasea]|uniref:DUF1737 domain-containing protein n=2 Tax=Cellulomonas cellasea TaxID=43670 RepID=A0A0A0B2Z6_9CELL|nr:DUF1737 domain-containing protein [Cellulomonas cellasea]KGM01215.1 hypothetical protein Q760_02970 [Cellulomonas cellasea DSM 20118]GEA87820.1 hypothetical protein CCE01nite_17690 [Cellulomonas cellasea]